MFSNNSIISELIVYSVFELIVGVSSPRLEAYNWNNQYCSNQMFFS